MTALNRRDRLLREHIHDPYQARQKLRGPVLCPECGAVYAEGRWRWPRRKPKLARNMLCQACRRTHDDCAAGILTITGAFARAHRDEILALCRHQEAQENRQHPLHRMMRIGDGDDRLEIRTTDMHLPQRLGKSLRRAYRGELHMRFDREANLVRVGWQR